MINSVEQSYGEEFTLCSNCSREFLSEGERQRYDPIKREWVSTYDDLCPDCKEDLNDDEL